MAFETLKKALTQAPILTYPDFSKPFKVTVDACSTACGAVLSQDHDGQDKPITFISKTFKKGEINKPIIEKELIAIHFAINVLRPYLYGTEFTVFSDHKPLLYLYKMKNPSSKLVRIRLELEEYNFNIVHIKGKDNVVADALSRISIQDLKNIYNYNVLAITRSMTKKPSDPAIAKNDIDTLTCRVHEETHTGFIHRVIRAKMTKISSARDDVIKSITVSVYKNHCKLFDCNLNASSNETISLKELVSKLDGLAKAYQISKIQWPLYDKFFNFYTPVDFKQSCNENLKHLEIILIHRPLRINTKEEKLDILKKFHDSELYGGHCGQKRMYAKLRTAYYWPKMTVDIAKYIKSCHICKLTKPGQKTRENMTLTQTPLKPFDMIQIDTIGPLTQSNSGNTYAITLVDELTKYLIILPVRDKSAKTVARSIFENFILTHGPMRGIKTDLGTEYINSTIQELCSLLKIKHAKSTAYHHETLGGVERNHRTLNQYLRAYLNGNLSDWDTYANYFAFCYNTTPNSNTDYKYSPHELVYGKAVNLTTDFLGSKIDPLYNLENIVSEMKFRLQKAHIETRNIVDKMKLKNKLHYDKSSNEVSFKIGDKIKIKNEPQDKFKFTYSGPFSIIKIEDKNLIIDLNGKLYKIHKNRANMY